LHVALNSAGIGHETPAEDLDPADWRRMIEVNLTGCSSVRKPRRGSC
jgi:NAD(P)-dependent dehydrogenase (short-subunit alcohol dehydrogenase family)